MKRVAHAYNGCLMKSAVVKATEAGRLKWYGHFPTIQEEASGRELTFHKPEGSTWAGRRTVGYLPEFSGR